MENHTQLLQTLIASQVLTLAKIMKAEKHTVGYSGGQQIDYIPEAIALIFAKQTDIWRLISKVE
jgi:hypothetical protein